MVGFSKDCSLTLASYGAFLCAYNSAFDLSSHSTSRLCILMHLGFGTLVDRTGK